MITRFDHAVIAVSDVAAAIDAFAALGFDVAAGGRHPSIGTANAIVRFGLDYLELLAVEDPDQAQASGPFGAELKRFLEQDRGLVGFVLASSNLDEEADRLAELGQVHTGPFAMDRERPDGRRLAWRLVIPGSSPWRKPWPFLIEWETPDAERVSWDAPGEHANHCSGVAGIELLVADLSAAREFYERGLGLPPTTSTAVTVDYVLGEFVLHVTEPADDEQQAELERLGPGPFRLLLRGADGHDDSAEPALSAACGARIRFLP